MPRVSTCGCGCRPDGTTSRRQRAEARRRSAGARHGLRQSDRQAHQRGCRRSASTKTCWTSVLKVAGELAGKIDAAAPSIDGLLAIKGVIEVVEPEDDEEEDKAARSRRRRRRSTRRLPSLVEMRRREGATLGQILSQRLDEIERLAKKAEAAPGRKPEAIKARLAEQIATLLDSFRPLRCRPAASGSDHDRHQGRHPRGTRPASPRMSRRPAR